MVEDDMGEGFMDPVEESPEDVAKRKRRPRACHEPKPNLFRKAMRKAGFNHIKI